MTRQLGTIVTSALDSMDESIATEKAVIESTPKPWVTRSGFREQLASGPRPEVSNALSNALQTIDRGESIALRTLRREGPPGDLRSGMIELTMNETHIRRIDLAWGAGDIPTLKAS